MLHRFGRPSPFGNEPNQNTLLPFFISDCQQFSAGFCLKEEAAFGVDCYDLLVFPDKKVREEASTLTFIQKCD